MKDSSRRSFVKTSAATGLTFTFAGLIRAHGQSGGVNTTWNPEGTFFSINSGETTTYDPNGTYVTTDPGVTTTWDPDATTVPETTTTTEITTTEPETTAVKYEYALKCTAVPTDIDGVELMPNGTYTSKFFCQYDPDGPREKGTISLLMSGHGPHLNQISTTMNASVSASIVVHEKTVLSFPEIVLVDAGGTPSDDCVVSIDSKTGLVTVQPNAPLQTRKDGTNCSVYVMATAAFDLYAYGVYDEDSWLPGSVTVPLPKGA
jgi:hypothetical protein